MERSGNERPMTENNREMASKYLEICRETIGYGRKITEKCLEMGEKRAEMTEKRSKNDLEMIGNGRTFFNREFGSDCAVLDAG